MGCTSSKESSSTTGPCKLVYFGVYARGEPLRMLLNYGKVQFEDCRITGEQYGEMRKTGELKSAMPIWIEGGRQMN